MTRAEPQARYCPSCGGPNPASGKRACRFCEGPLVPIGSPDPRRSLRCGGCSTAVPEGGSFCGHCGQPLVATEPTASPLSCPGCGAGPMRRFGLSPTVALPAGNAVDGCPVCGGVWVHQATLQSLLAAAAAHSIPDGNRMAPQSVHRRNMTMAKVVYRPCAMCGELMQRKNFGLLSGVIVDQCRVDGTYFDAGELEDVLAFVRSGGLRLTAERDAEERAREARQRPGAAPPLGVAGRGVPLWDLDDGPRDPIGGFVRWAMRWVAHR